MNLFDEFKLRGITFRNRIGVSPMCMYSSENGFATDWHLVHLGSRAVGGAGLVMMEATAVEPRGRITPGDAGIWSDEHVAPLKRITRFLHEYGAVSAIQIAHAGRKASHAIPWHGGKTLTENDPGGWRVIGPSPVAFDPTYAVPDEMTKDDIATVVTAFREAARRADEAGFQLLEIHSAHGYLLHSFLSPLSNQRRDEYGGSFENRIRLVLEVTKAVREIWPKEKPLAIRFSSSDWTEGGWTIEDTVEVSKRVHALGVDLVDCSSGGNVATAKIPVGAGYQVPFAEKVRAGAGVATAAVGLVTEPMQADQIIRNGQADFVFLARASLRDPYWPLHAAQVLGKKPELPNQYLRGF